MIRIEIIELDVNDLKELIAQAVYEGIEKYKENIVTTEEDFIGRREVAEIFKVSIVTVDTWRAKGILKEYRIGNKVLFKRSEVLNVQ